MGEPALLACDWGTTNLRAWVLDAEGAILRGAAFDLGVSRLAPGEAKLRFEAEVRPALTAEGLPAIFCGMVGSNLGWAVAPYVDCPAGASSLAGALLEVESPGGRVRIAPGVRGPGFNGRGDVMRGEETQVLGWLRQSAEQGAGRRLVCLPGTHAKWIRVEEGRIAAFVTAMTGELFALLLQHSVLRGPEGGDDPAAFDDGVAAAGEGDALAARLFTARSRVVGRGASPQTTASYLSGLLIGADVATTPRLLGVGPDEPVVLLGAAELCTRYARAIRAHGGRAEVFDGATAAAAGLHALHQEAPRP